MQTTTGACRQGGRTTGSSTRPHNTPPIPCPAVAASGSTMPSPVTRLVLLALAAVTACVLLVGDVGAASGSPATTAVVVTLKAAPLDGDRLTFEVDRLDGDLAGANGPASVFIETVNVPLARLTARSGSWYVGSQ